MNDVFILGTGGYLPGNPVPSSEIQDYLGSMKGENLFKDRILGVNKIHTRHYARDKNGNETEGSYDMLCKAIDLCLDEATNDDVGLLAAGSTCLEYILPGCASMTHGASKNKKLSKRLEVVSSIGGCTAGSQAFINAYRAVRCGDVRMAVAAAVERTSRVTNAEHMKDHVKPLKAADIKKLKDSDFFRANFLRFMLSDAAGAVLFGTKPTPGKLNFRVDWVEGGSYAHALPMCMQMQESERVMRQDVRLLNANIIKKGVEFFHHCSQKHNTSVQELDYVLVHISSYFFLEKLFQALPELRSRVWTNLDKAGNAGAASIYVMFDEAVRAGKFRAGDRILLYIPESARFNYNIIHITALDVLKSAL